MSFDTVLVANRGEVALRIMRTLRRMGLGVVAVYSDADRESPHVEAADRAIAIGPAPARESYLNIAAVVEAARRGGAGAVHPGYGFLAENADFADAVVAAGLVFVGPSGAAMRAMAHKGEAKRIAAAAGMPCVAGYAGADQGEEAFAAAAERIGWPVMVKAAAGGGGRGMRRVDSAEGLRAALASARSEAQAAFGSAELLLERALVGARHVEIQLLADDHGQVLHLGERDCSLQRRHQKIIEEAPSPAVDAALRERMGAAAVAAARAIRYRGAGTVEFLLAKNGDFHFIEMNTRLQVEHAVTEALTGIDIVEWQLRIAAGEALPWRQSELRFEGHAIEARLVAEDVGDGFLPQTGRLLHWQAPEHGVRVDHALADGSLITPHYDSMIAKIIAHGATREEARRKLLRAVEQTAALGVATNQGLLADLLADPVFAEGREVDTGFIAAHYEGRATARPDARGFALAAFAALAATLPQAGLAPPSTGGFESVSTLACGGLRRALRIAARRGAWAVTVDDEAPLLLRHARRRGPNALVVECDGLTETIRVAVDETAVHLLHAGRGWIFEREDGRRSRAGQMSNGAVTAPLTGRIVELAVREGDAVQAGQHLLTLEAMKMEHALAAPCAGRVAGLRAAQGGQAAKGALLLTVEAAP